MYRNIFAAFDGSAPSEYALTHAARLAQALGAKLYVGYVEIDPSLYFPLMAATSASSDDFRSAVVLETMAVREAALNVLAGIGITCEFLTLPLLDNHAHIADRILREVRRVHADLLVTGSHGRRGLARLTLGSEANRMLQDAELPVLIVKAKGGLPADLPSTT